MDLAALFVEEALATEELQEWLSVSVMHDCLTGIDGLYNSLLFGAVNSTEYLVASAMEFAPGMWLDQLLDSGNIFAAVIPESTFATAKLVVASFHI